MTTPEKRSRRPGRGAGRDLAASTQTPALTVLGVEGDGAKGYHAMTRAERLAALQERMWQIAMGTAPNSTPVQVSAAVAFLNRELGLPRQSMELSGANGEAIKQEMSITVAFRKPDQ